MACVFVIGLGEILGEPVQAISDRPQSPARAPHSQGQPIAECHLRGTMWGQRTTHPSPESPC